MVKRTMESSRRSQQTLPREVREAVSSGHLLAVARFIARVCGEGGRGCRGRSLEGRANVLVKVWMLFNCVLKRIFIL